MSTDINARGMASKATSKFQNIDKIRVSEGNYQYTLDGTNWVTLSGGGIGTLDYNDLSNKPIINVPVLPTEDILFNRIYQVEDKYYIMPDFSAYTQTLPPAYTTEVPNNWVYLTESGILYYNKTDGLLPYPVDFTGSFNCSLRINGLTYTDILATCAVLQNKTVFVIPEIEGIISDGGFVQNNTIAIADNAIFLTESSGNSAFVVNALVTIIDFELLSLTAVFQNQNFISDFQYQKLNFLGINTLSYVGNTLYVDSIIGDDEGGNGSAGLPYASVNKVITLANTLTGVSGFTINIANGTYDLGGINISLPDKPFKIYGNMATITNSGGTITVPNSEFYCEDLNVTGNIIFAGTTAGKRVLCDNVQFAGNIECNGFTDFTTANISGGTITIESTSDLYIRGSKNYNQILSTGKLTLIDTDMMFSVVNDYLIKSTAGTINIVNSQVVNTNYTYRQMAVYCHNDGSAATPNIFANTNLTVYGVINSGDAYTSFTNGATIFSPDSFLVSSHLTPLPIVIAMALMSLGSDAAGDIYYRNSSGSLARIGIGTNGQRLSSNGTIPAWVDNTAVSTTYNNETSGLSATNVQAAIDEVYSKTKILFNQTSSKTNNCDGNPQSIIGTGVGSVILPANTIKVGDLIHVIVDGIVSANSNDSITLSVKFNDVTIYTQTTTTNTTFTNTPFNSFGDITIRTIGETGTVALGGVRNIFAAVGFGTVTALAMRGSATIDTTIDNEIKIEYTAPTGASITTELLTIYKRRYY